MFKKSLVALALVTASTAAFAAADIETGTELAAINVSIEGAVNMTEIAAGNVVIVLGAEYAVGDIITLTFSGADLDATTVPSTLTALNATNDLDVTVGLLSATSNTVTYRVTEVKDNGNATLLSSILATFTISGLEFDTESVLASSVVTVGYAAETSTGVAIDEGSKSSADMITTQQQFSLDRSGDDDFDAIIDVEASRMTFADGDVIDAVEITLEDNSAATVFDATGGLFEVVINGSFAYLDDDTDTDGVTVPAGTFTVSSGTIAPADITADSVTIKGVAAGTLLFTLDAEGAATPAATSDEVIPTIDYTATVSVDYSDSGTDGAGAGAAAGNAVVATGTDIGEWALNGSVVDVPYIPFGPNTQPIIRHTNIGTQTGDVSMRYMVEGEHTAYQSSGIIVEQATPGVRNLLSLVTDALAADGYDASVSGFKVAVEITTNVPAADVTVYAAAKVTTSDSDRLTIGAFSN